MAVCLATPSVPSIVSDRRERAQRSAPQSPAAPTLPVRFEANAGQFDGRVRYLARGSGLTLFLGEHDATMSVGPAHRRVTMRVKGASTSTPPLADGRLTTLTSYFLGNDPSRWHTGVPSFARVTYRGVAPGVDQVFHGEAGHLEYNFIVAPGTRPDALELTFDGADRVALDDRGNLRLDVPGGSLVQPPPRVYQRVDGRAVAVAGSYRVRDAATVTFDVGAYDPAAPLVIDPVLAYSSYLGGGGNDYGYGIAVDASGAIYVGGFTSSTNFPTRDAYQATLTGEDDAFVAKLDPTGASLVYATYIGGSQGAYGYGIAVDSAGAAYLVGETNSPDFPSESGYQRAIAGGLDAFVTKLSPSGTSLSYSTYLGGANDDSGYGIAVDSAGEAFVTGTTQSGDLPTHAGSQPSFGGVVDGFVTKLGAKGNTLVYSSYLGGSADDEARALAIDGTGAAYVTGYTTSIDFPTAAGTTPFQALNNGNQNAFVAKLVPSGASLAYSTYLGGSQNDRGASIAVDTTGTAFVTGLATSADFPTLHAFQAVLAATGGTSNAFVARLDTAGAALLYSTYLGGSGGDVGSGVALDVAGEAFVTGYTSSTDFPTKDAPQPMNAASQSPGGTSAFVAELAATGSELVYSTYLGGSVGDSAEALAVGPSGGAYVTGYTVSPDFPTVTPEQAHLASGAGDNAFVAVLADVRLDGDASVDAAAPVDAGGTRTEDAGASVFDAAEPVPDARAATVTVAGDGCSCRSSRGTAGRSVRVGYLALLGLTLYLRRRRRIRERPFVE
jgi:MYXO-CTERM domain-containing protein